MSKTNIEQENKPVKVDILPADPLFKNFRHYTVSFLSPEGLKNCNIRALKVRGAYETLDEAKTHANKLTLLEPNIPIFVGDLGKWCPWDQSPTTIDEVKHSNNTIEDIMSKYKVNQDQSQEYMHMRPVYDKKAKDHREKLEKENVEKVEKEVKLEKLSDVKK